MVTNMKKPQKRLFVIGPFGRMTINSQQSIAYSEMYLVKKNSLL